MDFNWEKEVVVIYNEDEFISVGDEFVDFWLCGVGKVLCLVFKLCDCYVSVNVIFEIFVNYD